MPKTPKPPAYPNPSVTANTQQGYNQQAAQNTQGINMVNQNTPFGTEDYTSSIDPVTGLPRYSATTTYSPEQQALLDQLQSTQNIAGGAGNTLAGNTAAMYGQAPDFSTGANSLVTQGMNNELPYMERFMAPARDQLDNNLRNQGILPGTPAYQQQVDAQTQQQDLDKGNWLNQYQNQAYNQAVTSYTTPEQMISSLMNLGMPSNLKNSLVQTPQTTEQAPDYSGQVAQQYQAQMNAYQAAVQRQNSMMSGIMGAGGMLLGGPLGGALGSGLGSMASGAGNMIGSALIPGQF